MSRVPRGQWNSEEISSMKAGEGSEHVCNVFVHFLQKTKHFIQKPITKKAVMVVKNGAFYNK